MEKGLAFDNPFIMGTVPIESMYGPLYGIFIYMYDKNQPNVTKYIVLLPNQVPQQVVKLPPKQNREVRLYIPAKTNGWNLQTTSILGFHVSFRERNAHPGDYISRTAILNWPHMKIGSLGGG